MEAHLKAFEKRIRPRPFLAAHVLSVFLLLPGLILMLTAMATVQVGVVRVGSGVVQDQSGAAAPIASVTPEADGTRTSSVG
jgi:hypothetical protein